MIMTKQERLEKIKQIEAYVKEHNVTGKEACKKLGVRYYYFSARNQLRNREGKFPLRKKHSAKAIEVMERVVTQKPTEGFVIMVPVDVWVRMFQ